MNQNEELARGKKTDDVTEYALLTLKPKKEVFNHLIKVSEGSFVILEESFKSFLDDDCLESHTVAVCIPSFAEPNNLFIFIQENSHTLIDLMLATWSFPLDAWGLKNKNIELMQSLIEVKYYPMICKAITTPVNSTLDLAVTLATPTPELVDYVIQKIKTKAMVLSEDELNQMEFALSTGVAIVTNQMEPSKNQDVEGFLLAFNNPMNYLDSLKKSVLKTFFCFYFNNPSDFPKEMGDEFVNRWFNMKTCLGLYMLPNNLMRSECFGFALRQ